jgi:hypothetical protein
MLDSTLKGPNANSYVSLDYAIAYFASRPYGFALPEDEYFESYLIHATSIVDRYVEWIGCKTTDEQRLEWPRRNIYGVNPDTIPFDICMAQCEMSLAISESNILSSDQLSNFESVKVSSIQLKLSQSAAFSSSVIPSYIQPLIERYGTSGGINCKLVRV